MGSYVSAASAFLVCLSVLYDWAYFRFVGPEFFQMMSVGDHVTSILEILPVFSLWLFLGALVGALRSSLSGEVEGVDEEVPITLRQLLKRTANWLVPIALCIFGYWVMGFEDGLIFAIFIAGLLWLDVSEFLLERHPTITVSSRGGRFLCIIGPAIVFMIVATGLLDGKTDLQRQDGNALLYLRDSDQEVTVSVLRHLDQGLLVKQHGGGNITLISWAGVERIELRMPESDNTPLICKWVNIETICDDGI